MKKLIALTKNTFRETIRDRVLLVIVFFAVLFVLSAKLMAEVSAGENEKITLDFGLAMINIFGVLIVIFTGTSLIHKEIDQKTIYTLLSKPIPRSTFIISKFFGLGLVLLIILTIMSGIFFLIVPPTGKILLALAFMFLSLLLLLAVVIFFSSFMRPLLASFSAIAAYLIGHLTDELKIFAHHNNLSDLFKNFADTIYLIWPNFKILNLKNIVSHEGFIFTANEAFYAISMGLIFIFLLLYAGTLIFKKREF